MPGLMSLRPARYDRNKPRKNWCFTRLHEYVRRHDDVWVATRLDIVRHFAKVSKLAETKE